MTQNKEIPKLTTILHADVKGYSCLIGENVHYTGPCMAECLQLFVEMYRGHGCGVFNAATDSVMAEFPIMVSAVKCAVNVQA